MQLWKYNSEGRHKIANILQTAIESSSPRPLGHKNIYKENNNVFNEIKDAAKFHIVENHPVYFFTV